MKKLLVMFVSVICILSACQRGPNPKDSLIATGNALQNCDANNVDKYIDLSSLMSNAIDTLAKQEIKELPKDEVMGLAAMKMLIIPIAKQYALEGIRQLANSEYKEYPKLIKVTEYKILSNKDGIASAKVVLNFEEAKKFAAEKNLIPPEAKPYMDNTETTLVLQMKQNGDYWQITEITNLGELVAKYAPLYEEQKKKAEAEKQVREALVTANIICKSQLRYNLQTGKLVNDFAAFDIDFKEDNGQFAKGPSFNKKGVTYELAESKVIVHGTKPGEYTIEKECIGDNNTVCQDNGAGICKTVGL